MEQELMEKDETPEAKPKKEASGLMEMDMNLDMGAALGIDF